MVQRQTRPRPSLINRLGTTQRFQLDLRGYLVIENALDAGLLSSLNSAIEQQFLPPPTTYNYFGTAPHGAGFLDWDPVFANLIDHVSVVDWIQFLIGGSYTLERIQGIYEEQFIGTALPTPQQSKPDVETRSRLACEVIWNLTDTGPGIGGLACIEGSHNHWGEIPSDSVAFNDDFVTMPRAPAGSAIICTNRLRRGHGQWHGPHQRRSLVFQYAAVVNDTPEPQLSLPRHGLTFAQSMYLGYEDNNP